MSLSSVSVVLNALRLKLFKPNIGEDIKEKGVKKMTKVLKVDGMTCGHCKARIEKVLNALKEVENTTVNLDTKEVTINLLENIDEQVLVDTITEAGYEVIK